MCEDIPTDCGDCNCDGCGDCGDCSCPDCNCPDCNCPDCSCSSGAECCPECTPYECLGTCNCECATCLELLPCCVAWDCCAQWVTDGPFCRCWRCCCDDAYDATYYPGCWCWYCFWCDSGSNTWYEDRRQQREEQRRRRQQQQQQGNPEYYGEQVGPNQSTQQRDIHEDTPANGVALPGYYGQPPPQQNHQPLQQPPPPAYYGSTQQQQQHQHQYSSAGYGDGPYHHSPGGQHHFPADGDAQRQSSVGRSPPATSIHGLMRSHCCAATLNISFNLKIFVTYIGVLVTSCYIFPGKQQKNKMKFGASAEELFVSSCRTIIAKLGGCGGHDHHTSNNGAAPCEDGNHQHTQLPQHHQQQTPTFIKTTHAFSGRLDEAASSDGSNQACSASSWDVALQLVSKGPEPPSMLVGLGPRALRSTLRRGDNDSDGGETQRMFEGRILSTPLVWEEPGFLFMECSDHATRLWSETFAWYGKPTHTASTTSNSPPAPPPCCFQFSEGQQRWVADVRIAWTVHANATAAGAAPLATTEVDNGLSHCPEGTFEMFVRHPSHSTALATPHAPRDTSPWSKVVSGVYQPSQHEGGEDVCGIAPYVTLLNHLPSEVRIISAR